MKYLFFISRNYMGGGKTKILQRSGQQSQQDNQRHILKRFVYNIYICSKNTSNLPSEIWPCVQVSFQLWVKIGLEFVLEPSCMRRCSLSNAQLQYSSKKYQHQRMLDMTSFHRKLWREIALEFLYLNSVLDILLSPNILLSH